MNVRKLAATAALALAATIGLGAAPASAGTADTLCNYSATRHVLVRNDGVDRTLPAGRCTQFYLGWKDVDYAYVPWGYSADTWKPGYSPKSHWRGPVWVSIPGSGWYIQLYTALYV